VVTLVVLVTVVVSWQLMERRDKETWMLSPYAVKHGREVWRVLTHAFIHADWMHLAFNMFVLYEFGQTVEHDLGFLGWMGFPALYLAGIVGGAIPALRKHGDNPNYRSLGASGAVSAILLAFISLHPTRTLLLFFVVPSPPYWLGCSSFGTKAGCSNGRPPALRMMRTLAGPWWVCFGSLPWCQILGQPLLPACKDSFSRVQSTMR